jgi:hypothetical protein
MKVSLTALRQLRSGTNYGLNHHSLDAIENQRQFQGAWAA